MIEPIGDSTRPSRGDRKFIHSLILGGMVVSILGLSANAGAIRRGSVSAKALVKIQKADPNSDYWVKALKNQTLKLKGPRTPTVIALNADGTVPDSAFLRYMSWREGLNAKRFGSFHPEIVKLLRKIKKPPTPTEPGTIVPPSPGVPIGPPDFTPITPHELTPPNVPEPSTMILGVSLIGAMVVARRLRP